MIIESCIIGLCVLILITILIILIYFGYFNNVEISLGSPPLNFSNKPFAFKSFKDNFSGIGFQFTKLHNLTAIQDKKIQKLFNQAIVIGIYYDNLDQTKDAYKFSIGVLLDGDSNCTEIRNILKKENYKFSTLPETDHVVYTSFPFKGMISVSIAIRSVYPKLNQFVREKKLCAYPLMEFYTQDQIHFILPLNKQQDFIFYSIDNESSGTENKDLKKCVDLEKEDIFNDSDDESYSDKMLRKKLITKQKEDKKKISVQDGNSSGSSFDEINLDENVN